MPECMSITSCRWSTVKSIPSPISHQHELDTGKVGPRILISRHVDARTCAFIAAEVNKLEGIPRQHMHRAFPARTPDQREPSFVIIRSPTRKPIPDPRLPSPESSRPSLGIPFPSLPIVIVFLARASSASFPAKARMWRRVGEEGGGEG
jgi:hypothetical protein